MDRPYRADRRPLLGTVATEPLVPIGEAARQLGVPKATVYRLIAANKMPALRIGGQLRLDPVELHAWVYGSKNPKDD